MLQIDILQTILMVRSVIQYSFCQTELFTIMHYMFKSMSMQCGVLYMYTYCVCNMCTVYDVHRCVENK